MEARARADWIAGGRAKHPRVADSSFAASCRPYLNFINTFKHNDRNQFLLTISHNMQANNVYANPASGVDPFLSDFRLQAAVAAKLQRAERIPRRRCLDINQSVLFTGTQRTFAWKLPRLRASRRAGGYARSLKRRLAAAA